VKELWYDRDDGGGMKTRYAAAMLVGLMLCLLVSSSALGKGKKKQSSTQQPAPATQPSPVNSAAVTAAEKELADARTALVAATKKAEADFEASPEFVAADKEVKAEQAAYDAKAAPIIQKLHADPAYVAAKAKSDKTQAELADLRTNGGSDDDVMTKSQEAMVAITATYKIQSEVLADDPSVAEAHSKLMDAETAKALLVAQFHAKLGENSDYATAKTAVDAATRKLAAAQKGA
jgi:hypothetical protein